MMWVLLILGSMAAGAAWAELTDPARKRANLKDLNAEYKQLCEIAPH
jgi:hypothetical protein